jgi:hypothetical protein
MRVILKASDVAACVGQNRFKPSSEVCDELWKRYGPTTFKGKTKRDAEEESLARHENAATIVRNAVAVRAKNSDEAQATFLRAQEDIKKLGTLSIDDEAKVLELLRSKIYTTHGTRSENRTSDKLEAEEGVVLKVNNEFHKYQVCILGQTEFVIVGKVDRIEHCPDGSKVLVEIKNRTKKLFRAVYPSENIQMQTYMQMLNLNRAKLVEQFNNETNTMIVERDDDYWQDFVLPELVNFCRDLYDKLGPDAE